MLELPRGNPFEDLLYDDHADLFILSKCKYNYTENLITFLFLFF